MRIAYHKVKDLPTEIRNPLCDIGYGKDDILVETEEKVSMFSAGGDGYRSFFIMIDLNTGESKIMRGSWGGANPWNPTNPVDLNDKEYTLPVNGCVIHGREGGGRPVLATIILHPKAIVPWLESRLVVTEEERKLLEIIRTHTSAGRKAFLHSKKDLVDSLVERRFLARTKRGAISITTSGKNASLKRG